MKAYKIIKSNISEDQRKQFEKDMKNNTSKVMICPSLEIIEFIETKNSV